MRRIFLSDLHLEAPETDTFNRFSECLAWESQRVDEIYVLGDLVEMWVGDDDDGSCARAVKHTLRQAVGNCPVYLMHGNRDFLIGADFADTTGVTLVSDPHTTTDSVILSHGDALCTDDHEYQTLRQTFRSDAWQQEILSKTLQERQQFGAALRAQSRANNANKSANIMDVNATAVAELVAESELVTDQTVLIHGHTHRPGIHTKDSGQRIVLGSWQRCGWLCRQDDASFDLECFSLARRYGT